MWMMWLNYKVVNTYHKPISSRCPAKQSLQTKTKQHIKMAATLGSCEAFSIRVKTLFGFRNKISNLLSMTINDFLSCNFPRHITSKSWNNISIFFSFSKDKNQIFLTLSRKCLFSSAIRIRFRNFMQIKVGIFINVVAVFTGEWYF